MKKTTCLFILLLVLGMTNFSYAQSDYSHSQVEGNTIVFFNPTYDGIPINNNTNTYTQWALELGYGAGYEVTDVTECFDPNETVPDCSSWGLDDTAGYNYGTWEVHNCSYNGWTWDHCYRRVVAVRVEALIQTVQIDIKPGSDPNCFNNDGHGVIPVAILGSASFDATRVDPTTVELQGLAVRAVGKKGNLQAHTEDVNGDSYADLVVQIEDNDGAFSEGQGDATLTGNLYPAYGGTPIEGTDTICIRPK